jgi:predicted secreted protein
MTISAAFVLYAVIWFLTLFIVLPLKLTSQRESGSIIDGTPASAPINPQIKTKMFWVSIITTIIWIPICLIIIFGIVTISDLDFYGKLNR